MRGTILFVHGSSMASQPTFDLHVPGRPHSSAMDWFAERGFDTWTMDNEGYGRSDKSRADQLRHHERRRRPRRGQRVRPEARPAPKKLLMYGISSGALKAALFAQRHPERVARLALDAFVWTGEGSPTLEQRKKKLPEFQAKNRRPDRPRVRAQHLQPRPSRHRRRGDDRGLRRRDPRARRLGADRHLRRHVLEAAAGRSGEDHRADHRHARRVRRHRRLRRPDRVLQAAAATPTSSSGDGRHLARQLPAEELHDGLPHPALASSRSPSRCTGAERHETFAPDRSWRRCLRCRVSAAFAQAYPAKPVRLIVPFAPGGFTDVVARILGQKLSAAMGQQFVVENKPGAGSTIGTDFVAKAPPDGYTLLMVVQHARDQPAHLQEPAVRPDQGLHAHSKLVDSAVRAGGQPESAGAQRAGVDRAGQAAPGTIDYASRATAARSTWWAGCSSPWPARRSTTCPIKAAPGAAADLVGRRGRERFAGVPNALAQVPQGRLKALAVTTAKRVPQLPDVPTMQEAGVPGYDASVWLALLAPAGTPPEIVERLNAEVGKLMNTPDTKKALFDAGVQPDPSTPEAMSEYMVQEMARWGKVVKEAGIKLE